MCPCHHRFPVARNSSRAFASLSTFNFGLLTSFSSTFQPFNRVSFLSPSSPHLCALCLLCGENSSSFRSSLISRHSPLTAKSFTIRTSKTPLPQPLYNPHLQASLGSAGNKGLITPLESALTRNSPVSLLESALTKTGGWGYGVSRSAFSTPVKSHGLPPQEMQQPPANEEGLRLSVHGMAHGGAGGASPAPTRKFRNQDLIWPEAASQVTAARRKYDSLAMWHASAALWPKTASSVTGWRFFTPWKNFQRWGFSSSQETPRYVNPSATGSLPGFGSCSACHCLR